MFCSYPFVSLSTGNNKEIGVIIPLIAGQACWKREEEEMGAISKKTRRVESIVEPFDEEKRQMLLPFEWNPGLHVEVPERSRFFN